MSTFNKVELCVLIGFLIVRVNIILSVQSAFINENGISRRSFLFARMWTESKQAYEVGLTISSSLGCLRLRPLGGLSHIHCKSHYGNSPCIFLPPSCVNSDWGP